MLPVPPLPITHAHITSDHYSNFYHHRLALAVLELHKNGIIQYVVYCIWFLSLNIMYETFIHIDLIGFFLTLWTTTGTILCIYILLKVLSQIIFMVTFKKILRCKIYTHFIYEKAEIKKLFPCGTFPQIPNLWLLLLGLVEITCCMWKCLAHHRCPMDLSLPSPQTGFPGRKFAHVTTTALLTVESKDWTLSPVTVFPLRIVKHQHLN